MLLDWVSVSYPKKLELSIDKKKALQQCLLRGRSGEAVPVPFTLALETALSPRRSTPLPRAQVTFQFTKHETVDGQIWLIDQERASQPTSSLPHPPAPSPSPSLPPSPPPPGARQGRLRRLTRPPGLPPRAFAASVQEGRPTATHRGMVDALVCS